VAVVLLWGRLDAKSIPRLEESDRATAGYLLLALLPVALIGLVITVAIYMGIATPTEAAAVACVLTIGIAFWIGGLTMQGFLDSVKSTMRTMGYLGLLLSAAALFGFVFNYHRVPQQFTEAFLALELSPILILTFVIAFYVIVGMFLEPVSMTFITLPTLYPLIHGAGYDLIWFGIVYTITMEIAVLTPPVGLNLYVIQGLAPTQIRIQDVMMGVLPFIGALVCLIALLLSFPDLATWLPAIMGGGR